MKKFIVSICVLCIGCGAFATTVNYNWLVDGTSYAQTTCETGDDLILPTPTPTKYGYHFVGWVESEISGSWSQSGTPTPQNPIEPVFKPFSNTVLRAVGSGDNIVADSYDPETRTITRRIGVKVLNGTESVSYGTYGTTAFMIAPVSNSKLLIATHFKLGSNWAGLVDGEFAGREVGGQVFFKADFANGDVAIFKQWLADQYDAGTPVIIYYPLETPTEENLE